MTFHHNEFSGISMSGTTHLFRQLNKSIKPALLTSCVPLLFLSAAILSLLIYFQLSLLAFLFLLLFYLAGATMRSHSISNWLSFMLHFSNTQDPWVLLECRQTLCLGWPSKKLFCKSSPGWLTALWLVPFLFYFFKCYPSFLFASPFSFSCYPFPCHILSTFITCLPFPA